MTIYSKEYIVVCQSAWMNESGFGINYNWDGERFSDRAAAIRKGFEIRGSDDFNIGVVRGRRLISFDWMDEPIGEDDDDMKTVAKALGLLFHIRKPQT